MHNKTFKKTFTYSNKFVKEEAKKKSIRKIHRGESDDHHQSNYYYCYYNHNNCHNNFGQHLFKQVIMKKMMIIIISHKFFCYVFPDSHFYKLKSFFFLYNSKVYHELLDFLVVLF